MALDVCHRRAAGAAGILSAPLCRREPTVSAETMKRSSQSSGDRPRSVGDLFRTDPEDHHPRLAGRHRLPGRLLRHHLLGAAFPHHRAAPLDASPPPVISPTLIIGSFIRLSGRRVAGGSYRPAQYVPDLLAGCHRRGADLHPGELKQRAAVGAGLPARLLCLGIFLRHRRVPRPNSTRRGLRGSGQGFCYNFGRGIGALFPFLVGYLSQTTTLANAIAIFAVAAYASVLPLPPPCRKPAAGC